MEYLKAQYLDRYFSRFTCYPWEISSGNMGLAFTVMLMILNFIFIHSPVKHTRAVVKSTFVESKTSPSPKRFESESSPSPKRFESESSPSPKRFESKSKSKSK